MKLVWAQQTLLIALPCLSCPNVVHMVFSQRFTLSGASVSRVPCEDIVLVEDETDAPHCWLMEMP